MAGLNRMQNKLILINQYRSVLRNFSALAKIANQNKRVNEARALEISKSLHQADSKFNLRRFQRQSVANSFDSMFRESTTVFITTKL